jgi:SAM-dependent methyltransferase
MTKLSASSLIEHMATAIRPRLAADMQADLDFYVDESRYGLGRIASDLNGLAPGARILEIGAGSFLLSAALAGEGRDVTALEPVGEGFSFFHPLQAAILAEAEARGFAFRCLRCGIEDLDQENAFDYAFAIHVFEHVSDVSAALAKAFRALRPGGRLFILCPNYAFPYEVHFKIPIVGGKALTYRLFRQRIEDSRSFADPRGVWRSLNWISARSLAAAVLTLDGARARFRASALEDAVKRAATDPAIAARHPRIVIALCRAAVAVGAHRLGRLLGARFAPLIEAEIVKPERLQRSAAAGG